MLHQETGRIKKAALMGSGAVLCLVFTAQLWTGGRMTWIFFQFSQSSTTGDYRPTSSREKWTKTSWSRMHVVLKATSRKGMHLYICYRPYSKSCIDLSGVVVQVREYFFGMEVACFQIGLFVIWWCKSVEYMKELSKCWPNATWWRQATSERKEQNWFAKWRMHVVKREVRHS